MQLERECTELERSVEDLDHKIGNTKKSETEKLAKVAHTNTNFSKGKW